MHTLADFVFGNGLDFQSVTTDRSYRCCTLLENGTCPCSHKRNSSTVIEQTDLFTPIYIDPRLNHFSINSSDRNVPIREKTLIPMFIPKLTPRCAALALTMSAFVALERYVILCIGLHSQWSGFFLYLHYRSLHVRDCNVLNGGYHVIRLLIALAGWSDVIN